MAVINNEKSFFQNVGGVCNRAFCGCCHFGDVGFLHFGEYIVHVWAGVKCLNSLGISFLKKMEDISPFCVVTGTQLLDFW